VRVQGDYRQNPEGTGNMVVSHLPVGPCYFITPWNFPLAMATRKIAPALAAGCTVVIKPAALTPLTTILFVQLLEEAGLPYEVVPVDTSRGEQHAPAFRAINPNGKVPAIVDTEGPGGRAVRVFDSTAILIYLAEKTGLFLGAPEDRPELLSWLLFIASGIGPYSGQAVHFQFAAPEGLDYAVNRYRREAERHYQVLDDHLAGRDFIVGDFYTIADMSAWGWLDRAVETLGQAGLKVIMSTPTAAPPRWLVDRYPEILPHDADGRVRGFGSRRHTTFSSAVWFRESARIVTEFAERYGDNPHVAGWQTDNEYGCHDTVLSFGPEDLTAFKGWLRRRYQTPEALNEAWGNVFWSMELTSFDEVVLPVGAVTETGPAARLDYWRFASEQVVRYNEMQASILRRLSPGRFVTHNYMGFFHDFDHHAVSA